MTQQDDITQRLRDNADLDEAEHGNARVVQLEREAADEIERLRALLSKLRAEGVPVGWFDTSTSSGTIRWRDGLTAESFPDGHPFYAAPVASATVDEPPGGTRWPVLRAMARNYTAGKHTWDALDAEACEQAAEEIRHLRAALASAPADERTSQQIAHWKRSSELLDAIQNECWDVRFRSSPNGDAGDSSVGIEIVAHFMAAPRERVIGQNWNENLRTALEQAMNADAYPPARPALASAAVDLEAADVDFMARVFQNLDTWRTEDWNELLERRPAILALLRPLALASAPVAGEAARIIKLPAVDSALAAFIENSDGNTALVLVQAILDAAPQASEAVRNARAEGFQAGLDKALEVLEHDEFATRVQSAQVIRALKQPQADKDRGGDA